MAARLTKRQLEEWLEERNERIRHLNLECERLTALRDQWQHTADMENRERVRLEAILAIVKSIATQDRMGALIALLTPLPVAPPSTLRDQPKEP